MGYEHKKIDIPDILINPDRRDRYLYKDGYLSGFEKRYRKKHYSDYWKDLRKICKLSKNIKISIRDEIESGHWIFLRCKYLNDLGEKIDELVKNQIYESKATPNDSYGMKELLNNFCPYYNRYENEKFGLQPSVPERYKKTYETCNLDLAPNFVKDVFLSLIQIAEDSEATFENIMNYVEKIDLEEKGWEIQCENWHLWQSIEAKHQKVEEGYIYILSNKDLVNTYKIGFTANHPQQRADHLKIETKLDSNFILENFWKTKNPYKVEQSIFKELGNKFNSDGTENPLGYRVDHYFNNKKFSEFVVGDDIKFFFKKIEEHIIK